MKPNIILNTRGGGFVYDIQTCIMNKLHE